MKLESFHKLADRWRDEADRYERDGVLGHAALLRRVAADLDETLGAWWTEPLRIRTAAEESGRTYDTLQRALRTQVLPNIGRKGKPRIRRCDLYGGHRLEAEEVRMSKVVSRKLIP